MLLLVLPVPVGVPVGEAGAGVGGAERRVKAAMQIGYEEDEPPASAVAEAKARAAAAVRCACQATRTGHARACLTLVAPFACGWWARAGREPEEQLPVPRRRRQFSHYGADSVRCPARDAVLMRSFCGRAPLFSSVVRLSTYPRLPAGASSPAAQ